MSAAAESVDATALRAVALVEYLAGASGAGENSITIGECVTTFGIPRATCYRLLAALVSAGYAQKVGRGQYAAGWRLLLLGRSLDGGLVAAGGEPMRRLVERTGQSANLGLLDGADVVYVSCVESPASLCLAVRVGSRLPLNASAVGLAVAAHHPRAQVERLVRATAWTRRTPRGWDEPSRLLDVLDDVRARGFAVDDGVCAEDVRCVAVPVYGGTGRVVAGVGVTGLAAEFDPWAPDVVAAVQEAGAEISLALLGGQTPPGAVARASPGFVELARSTPRGLADTAG